MTEYFFFQIEKARTMFSFLFFFFFLKLKVNFLISGYWEVCHFSISISIWMERSVALSGRIMSLEGNGNGRKWNFPRPLQGSRFGASYDSIHQGASFSSWASTLHLIIKLWLHLPVTNSEVLSFIIKEIQNRNIGNQVIEYN